MEVRNVLKKSILLLMLLFVTACSDTEQGTISDTFVRKDTTACEAQVMQNEYLVQWKNGDVSVETAASDQELIDNIIQPYLAAINKAEPRYKMQAPTLNQSDDTGWGGEENWGRIDSRADQLWTLGVKGEGVTVAVIDSGVDLEHAELKNSLYINPLEIPDNGLDDDGNGFTDDVHGYDFFNRTGNVMDATGHGTHVSGIIAASHDEGNINGMAPKSKIMALRFMGDSGEGSVDLAIEAINYAVVGGAKIINASWGGEYCSTILQEKISSLATEGVLFVTAAGNSGQDISLSPEYPAAHENLLQITVGAHTFDHYLAGFSNLGNLVHLSAPGANIYSTLPGSTGPLSGTSMATPHVSAAAALLAAAFPQKTLLEIKEALVSSVQRGPYRVKSRGALDVKAAYDLLSQM